MSELGLPLRVARPVRVNEGATAAEGLVRPAIASVELEAELAGITGVPSVEFRLPTRVFRFEPLETDRVVARDLESGLPLIVRRGGDVIVNFDIAATRAFAFSDSRRPVYTYVPGFNIQKVPTVIRRPLSNILQASSSRRRGAAPPDFSKLPLTGFEFVILLLGRVLEGGRQSGEGAFRWPSGKRAVFVSLHDVDTGGFLRRRERDPLFRLEQRHGIRSTWFIPTDILGGKGAVDFLLQSGSEVGWHGHKHDHRLPFRPYADHHVEMLGKSCLAEPENFPTGMRSPKLMKSNYLFDLLERACPALCYDTSFSMGIVPYYLWLNGRQSKILEIPVTVPTDIGVYNKLHGVPRQERGRAILEAQIARTEKLMEVGAVISIVTHPEKDLSERPDFLEVYDRYLSYIKGRPDIWFATAGELFKYWTGRGEDQARASQGSKSGSGGERKP